MAWAYVNGDSRYGGSSGVSSFATDNSISVTSGNALIVAVNGYRGAGNYTVTGISDTAGNSFSLAGRYQNSGSCMEIWYAQNVTAHASDIVTATFSNSDITYPQIYAIQLSEMATSGLLDSGYTPAGNEDSTTPATTTASSTGGDGRVIVGVFYPYANSNYSTSSPSVLRLYTNNYGALVTNDATTSGSWSAAVGITSGTNHMCFARAFVVAAGGASAVPVMMRSYRARRN